MLAPTGVWMCSSESHTVVRNSEQLAGLWQHRGVTALAIPCKADYAVNHGVLVLNSEQQVATHSLPADALVDSP